MLVNQVLASTRKGESAKLLIVDINEELGLIAVSDVSLKTPKRPGVLSMNDVNDKLASGEWEILSHDFPAALMIRDDLIKPEHLARRDAASNAIAPLLEDSQALDAYLYGDASGMVSELMTLSGRSKKYITTQLNKHFYYGGFKNSVLPSYYFCGKNFSLPAAPKILADGSVCLAQKPGIETVYGEPYRSVTQMDVENVKKFARAYVKPGHQVVLEDLYADFIAKYYTVGIKNKFIPDEDVAEKFKIVLSRKHLISSRAFKRQINKVVSRLDWLRKRVGAKSFLRDHECKPGSAHHGLRGPTSRYEIDSTVLDVYVRYPYSEELLSIGRPILYLVIDVVTGMIVGMHVAFHGPDWAGARQALLNAFTDKVEFCKQFGVDIKESDWPCHHVCRELTADRGSENNDSNVEALLKGLIGISVVNLNPYYMGSAKGTVEKSFNTVQSKSLSFEAGKVTKVPKHDEKHASRRTLLTYDALMKTLIETILFNNNHTARINGRSFEMERDGCEFTSLAAWQYGMSRTMISKEVPKERLIYGLLPEKAAVVTAQGVRFQGLFYSSKAFAKLNKMTEAKNFGRERIDIRYSDSSTNSIWWRDAQTQKIYQLDLTDRSQAYKNQLWASVLHRLEIVKSELALLGEKNFAAKVKHRMSLHELENELKIQRKGLKASKAKSPASGIKERGALVGAEQKHAYDQETQAVLSTPPPTNKSPKNHTASQLEFGNANDVPFEEVTHGH